MSFVIDVSWALCETSFMCTLFLAGANQDRNEFSKPSDCGEPDVSFLMLRALAYFCALRFVKEQSSFSQKLCGALCSASSLTLCADQCTRSSFRAGAKQDSHDSSRQSGSVELCTAPIPCTFRWSVAISFNRWSAIRPMCTYL